MEKEIWKDIPEYEGIYQVSNLGNVKSLERVVLNKGKYPFLSKEKILKPYLTGKKGNQYFTFKLFKNGVKKNLRANQLVMIAFLNYTPDGHKSVIMHIDENPLNNNLSNLKIGSNRENCSEERTKKPGLPVGVSFRKDTKKYQAIIYFGSKKIHLGYFKTIEQASNAYQEKLKNINL